VYAKSQLLWDFNKQYGLLFLINSHKILLRIKRTEKNTWLLNAFVRGENFSMMVLEEIFSKPFTSYRM